MIIEVKTENNNFLKNLVRQNYDETKNFKIFLRCRPLTLNWNFRLRGIAITNLKWGDELGFKWIYK